MYAWIRPAANPSFGLANRPWAVPGTREPHGGNAQAAMWRPGIGPSDGPYAGAAVDLASDLPAFAPIWARRAGCWPPRSSLAVMSCGSLCRTFSGTLATRRHIAALTSEGKPPQPPPSYVKRSARPSWVSPR